MSMYVFVTITILGVNISSGYVFCNLYKYSYFQCYSYGETKSVAKVKDTVANG